MLKLKIITSTVRPGRKGPLVADWILQQVNNSGLFETELLDLAVINLPLMNEPVHPIMKQYEHEHTRQWSAKIDEADAFIFVTAEYDYNYPAPLRNAIEYLMHEWAFKPAGVVSYSIGPFAGVRAVAHLKADLLALRTIAIPEVVNIPSLNQFIDEEGKFTPNEQLTQAAATMIRQVLRWTKGLKVIKEEPVVTG
jgi:NAD(P)H-dependent FMN reductase